jgi:murein DD-endopeptidase MepM/ murein hydrolase activator NlpD
MKKARFLIWLWLITRLILCLSLLTACLPPDLAPSSNLVPTPYPQPQPAATIDENPARPVYKPGELVDYTAQSGDTLPALALRFNTTVKEIRAANTFIPPDATTMPPGMPMKIPIYYQPLWSNSYPILPDAHFVNGPAGRDFDPVAYVRASSGWLKNYTTYVLDRDRDGGEVVAYVSTNYSISPRFLLALLEERLGALSQAEMPPDIHEGYLLGVIDPSAKGLYRQLAAVANELNNTFYSWREGYPRDFTLTDGQMARPDPWLNAVSVALQLFYSSRLSHTEFDMAVSENGFAAVFKRLFGDPWVVEQHIPGSLRQPEMRLPFPAGASWSYTGGPHTPWGDGPPLGAIDFAPPVVVGGCTSTEEFATAVAPGIIARTGLGIAVLDLDGDGDERTGWVVFYLHLAGAERLSEGTRVEAGQPIGHPSCEGGKSTGTHIHIARKYNGEWIPAGGVLAFTLDGWVAVNGPIPYTGYLIRHGRSITACECSDQASQIQADFH